MNPDAICLAFQLFGQVVNDAERLEYNGTQILNNLNQHALKSTQQIFATESIYQTGTIQPHGALLVLSADKLRTVVQASANVDHFIDLPADGILGKSFIELIDATSAQQFEQLIQNARDHRTATGLMSVLLHNMPVDLDVYLYSADDHWVVEMTLDKEFPKSEHLWEMLMKMQDSLQAIDSGSETTVYFEQIARLVRALTGFDSVMVYRFQSNWDGEVIAQSCMEMVASCLGSQCPASDIPSQERLLCSKNRVRMVVDIASTPVPVLSTLNPDSLQPLDMSCSVLNSLSPDHLEYLRTKGVQASMSISLMQNGQLWGFIDCHHLSSKRVSFAMHQAAAFISRMISTELTSMTMKSELKLFKQISRIKTTLIESLLTQPVEEVLGRLSVDLLNSVNASGVIIIIEGRRYVFGSVPEPLALEDLLNWLEHQPISDVFCCNTLSEPFPPARFYQEIASGLITTMLAGDMHNGIIWLRPEIRQTVKSIGLYEQGIVQNPKGIFHLDPGNSIENRSELLKGKNEAWSALEIDIVRALGATLSEGLVHKYRAQRVENERKEALDRLNKIASQLPGMVFQFRLNADGSSCFPYVSDVIKNIYRLSPNDVREDASYKFTLIHPDDYEGMWLSIAKSAQDMSPWKHEYRLRFDDGTIRWLYGNAIPDRKRGIDGSLLWHGFITDITEQKNTQEILREKERMLSESQRVAHIGFWSLDLITDTLIWSDQMYSIHGVRKETFVHSQAAFVELIHPEDRFAMECWISDCRSGGLHKGIEFRIILSDGTVSFISCTGETQCHIDNKTQRIVGISQDITERKQLEQQDQDHLNQLAHVTRLGLMGEMASGIAHEVNQPLTAIANYAQVTTNLMKKESLDLIKLREVAVKIQDQALRAGQIIHRMKGFCKSNAQKLSTNDINKLINDCVSLCADGLKQNNIMLRLELEDNLPVINIDYIQIEQVLINLIRNGIDAILGAPEIKQGQITIDSYLTPKNEIQIRVNDNGAGIAEDQQPKILMPFHTTKADGMGMGLSISRSLIEAHNGTLHFNSKFGKGSTFYFTLPIESAGN